MKHSAPVRAGIVPSSCWRSAISDCSSTSSVARPFLEAAVLSLPGLGVFLLQGITVGLGWIDLAGRRAARRRRRAESRKQKVEIVHVWRVVQGLEATERWGRDVGDRVGTGMPVSAVTIRVSKPVSEVPVGGMGSRGGLQPRVEDPADPGEAREMSFKGCGGELGEYFKRTLAFFVGVGAIAGGVLQLPLHIVPAPTFQLH